ncbi:MAG TPA: MFS transporter [Thermoleophilaceae bacterium]|nr:MFS transporter [Thermoleophilaceae bacterium]
MRRSSTGVVPAALGATFLVLVAFTSAITTAGDTAGSFGAGIAWQTWILSSMSLGLAGALMTCGALADERGARWAMIAGAGGLLAASALAAVAPSIGVFVAARVLQGVAGAAMLVGALGFIALAVPTGPERTRATGLWGAMVGAGIAAGPVVAGLLAELTDWRLVHWAEAAGALAVLMVARGLPDLRARVRHPIDPPGALTLAASMSALTAGLVSGRSDWTAPVTVALLVAGVALLALFPLVEARRPVPMIEPALFREPLFVASVAGALFLGLSTIALMSYLPLFAQRVMGASVLGSAVLLTAWSGVSAWVAVETRRLPVGWDGRHRLIAGCAVCAAGLVALAFVGTTSSWAVLVPGMVVVGVGSGLMNAALGRLAVEAVPPERAGMSSGATNTARYLGGAAGVALTIAVATGGGTSSADLVAGWNAAALVAAAFVATGGLVAYVSGR